MSVVYPVALRSSRLQLVLTALGTAPVLQIGTAGMSTVLATLPCPNPPATLNSATATLTFSGVPWVDVSADASGTAAAAQFVTSSGYIVVSGLTVGLSSASDLVISQAGVSTGDVVSFISGTLVGN